MRSVMRIASVVALASSTCAAQSVTQLFNFSTPVNIENSALRPNGHLLFTTFQNGELYTLDPYKPAEPAKLVASFPGATAITGITAIGVDTFAVQGGVRGSYHYDNETIYTIDFNRNATVQSVAQLPVAEMLNGLAALPTQTHIVLSADSRVGGLWRIDTSQGKNNVQLAFTHEALAAPANATVPIGANGLKVVGEHVYFTSTARGIFGRVAVNEDATIFGEIEVIVSSEGLSWDDFSLDENGVAYVCQADNAIVRIALDGEKTTLLDDPLLLGPTSLTPAGDKQTLYVTTRGSTVNGVEMSGQVVEILLPQM